MDNWFENWFDSELYQKVYSHRNDSDAQKLLTIIQKNISITKDDWILDAACGNGRHIINLNKNEYNVVGFDLSITQLKSAKKISNHPFLVRGDLRSIRFKKKFNVILSLFTSFGYFENDIDNFIFINNSVDFIAKDGYFIIDLLNKEYLIKNLIPFSRKRIDNTEITEFREIKNDFIFKKIVLKENGTELRFAERVKVYDYQTLNEVFMKAGFSLLKIFGNYDGEEYNIKLSERMILVFKYAK